MSDPTLPDDELLRTARDYLMSMSSQSPPRDLEEDVMRFAFSRRRRFSLAALLAGSSLVLAGATVAVVALAFHHSPVAGIPAVTPRPSASTAQTPTPPIPVVSSPTPPAPSPTPSAPVLVVTEYGFKLTLSHAILDATYRIDHSFDGTHTDNYRRAYRIVGIVDLSTRSIGGNPGCAGVGEPYWYPMTINVFSTDPTHLSIASGPGMFVHIGQYWLGYSSPQYFPYSVTGNPPQQHETCAQAPSAVQWFSDAYRSIVPSR
jgi:hypothetical protein